MEKALTCDATTGWALEPSSRKPRLVHDLKVDRHSQVMPAVAKRRILLLAVWVVALCGRGWSAETGAIPVLTRIADIRALSRAEAQKGVPVKVRGVVTLCDGVSGAPEWLVLDDGAQSIW